MMRRIRVGQATRTRRQDLKAAFPGASYSRQRVSHFIQLEAPAYVDGCPLKRWDVL